MKIRTGFVSNSSSSSFICNVCGETSSGWDMCLSEAEMFECVNGHTCCNSHKLKLKADAAPVVPEVEDEDEDDDGEDDYSVDAKFCPICQFKKVYAVEAYTYLMRRAGLAPDDLLKEYAEKFNSYEEFRESIRAKK